jgi:CBS domain-containing protein/sporulation protein YlmC with PRC-barrel domain
MSFLVTYYLSRILDKKFFDNSGKPLGKLKDIIVVFSEEKPKVIAVKTIINQETRILNYDYFDIRRIQNEYFIYCNEIVDYKLPEDTNLLYLADNILDKQILDINGRKLVRVNDIRLVKVNSGSYAVAVDVGLDGIFRRLGLANTISSMLSPFKLKIPGKYILFDDVEAVDSTTFGITLSKPFTKLNTLHPSDLADVIEELDKKSRKAIFESLDEEKAADVLEELETDAQVDMIESLSIEKAADVLELMPADEAADLIDELEEDRAELLLNEIEKESSDDIREILQYEDDTAGSLMMTEFVSFKEDVTVERTIEILREEKPESDSIYYLYIVDEDERLIGTVSLRDLVIADPNMILNDIMRKIVAFVFDTDELDSIAEKISKYNLLAIPVTNIERKMEGVIVIDDIVEDLLNKRKTE